MRVSVTHWQIGLAACVIAAFTSPVGAEHANDASYWRTQGHTLCNVVNDAQEADLESANFYVHQNIILAIAGTEEKDSDEVVRRKVATSWDREIGKIYCQSLNFKGGSLIRYAVYARSDAFIRDVTQVWKLPSKFLNDIDRLDGRTLLDYIDDEIAATSSDVIKAKLRNYHDHFRRAGAQNRVEIDGIECRQEGEFRPDAQCRR